MDNSWWWLIGSAVVLAFIAIKTVPAIIGASMSVREAGRRYLSAEIKKYGIRQHILMLASSKSPITSLTSSANTPK